jgi:hypothetical protein
VAHACNPRLQTDQEDLGSKPAWANSSLDPILKIPNIHAKKKMAGVVERLPGVPLLRT